MKPIMHGSQAAVVARPVIDALLSNDAKLATKYLREDETLKARRVLYRGKLHKGERRVTVVLTYGRPNYAERRFIRKCKRAGEPFPVKKIQLKFPTR